MISGCCWPETRRVRAGKLMRRCDPCPRLHLNNSTNAGRCDLSTTKTRSSMNKKHICLDELAACRAGRSRQWGDRCEAYLQFSSTERRTCDAQVTDNTIRALSAKIELRSFVPKPLLLTEETQDNRRNALDALHDRSCFENMHISFPHLIGYACMSRGLTASSQLSICFCTPHSFVRSGAATVLDDNQISAACK